MESMICGNRWHSPIRTEGLEESKEAKADRRVIPAG